MDSCFVKNLHYLDEELEISLTADSPEPGSTTETNIWEQMAEHPLNQLGGKRKDVHLESDRDRANSWKLDTSLSL